MIQILLEMKIHIVQTDWGKIGEWAKSRSARGTRSLAAKIPLGEHVKILATQN